MSAVIPIYFDYASSLCYVAWRIVEQLQCELPIVPLWKGISIASYLGRELAQRPLSPSDRERVAMVSLECAVAVNPPARWIDSKMALIGSEVAREAGRFDAYHRAVFRAIFEQGRDLGRRNELLEAAAAAGLEVDSFDAALDGSSAAERLRANEDEGRRFSVNGFPSFMLGEFALGGIQPLDTMRLLIERFIQRRQAEPGA